MLQLQKRIKLDPPSRKLMIFGIGRRALGTILGAWCRLVSGPEGMVRLVFGRQAILFSAVVVLVVCSIEQHDRMYPEKLSELQLSLDLH